ncbi:ArdC family protein [Ferrovibrio sp.]|uniref:ArdC family protein n=1 Tax=Ferrovibrio sp. TaxID=1917215 RepID=UPI0035B324A7
MRDLYQTVTDQIIQSLEAGCPAWVKPWKDRGGLGVQAGMPYNAATGRQYNGINVPILWSEAGERGYGAGGWLTFKQARDNGGSVKKGERGTMIIFARQVSKEDESGKTKSFPVLSSFTVFHVSQCEGLPESFYMQPDAPKVPSNRVLQWVESAGASVMHGGNKAYYTTSKDHIQMPPCEAFKDVENYAATLLHESVHWSGGPKRLNREFGKRFGDDKYAFEELIAEIGAAFLCARLGIQGELQHASYIQSWIKVLKGDKRAIFTAASQASKAVDFLFEHAGLEYEEHEGEEESVTVPAPIAARNVICLPAPAPMLALPSPAMIAAMYGKGETKAKPRKAKPKSINVSVANPVPSADDYAVMGDNLGVDTLHNALVKQHTSARRSYGGSFPLSESQKRLYVAGIGHASGYWKSYTRDQSHKPAPDKLGVAMALAGQWERSGHIPAFESVKGIQWLEDWHKQVTRDAMADAAE